jgi:O-antigen/teichoic acid export membrane protein
VIAQRAAASTHQVRRALRLVPAQGAIAGSLAASLFSQGALVVTGVLVARTLGPTDRGYLALLFLLPTVLQQIGTLGLPLATTFFIASDPRQEASVRRNIRLPGIAQVVILTAIQAVVLWFVVAGEPHRVRTAAIVSLGILAGALADMYSKAMLQGQARYAAFNVLWNAISALYLVGVVGLVATGHADLVTISAAWVIANVAAGLLTLAIALRPRPRLAEEASDVPLRRMLRFGLRGFLGSLSPVATFRLDQAVTGLFLAPAALGLYVAALAFTTLPTFISRSTAMIALPQVARSDREARRETAWRFFFVSMTVTGLVVVVLEIFAGWLVPFFFGSDFDDAVSITRILLLSTFFYGARRVLTDSASGSGNPGLGSVAELTSWIVLVPLLPILMPVWGVDGVAAALAISSAVSLVALVLMFRFVAARGDDQRAESGLAGLGAGNLE